MTLRRGKTEAGPPLICSCTHEEQQHRPGGPCTGNDSYGLRCECPSFEMDRYWSGLEPGSDEPEDEQVGGGS